MFKDRYDIIVVGGGPAGLAAAVAAKESGAGDILILERSPVLGGILRQCIHTGFGLHYYGEELTGPEYAQRFIRLVREHGIGYCTGTMVLELRPGHTVLAVGSDNGMMELKAKAVIVATGCRERPRGAITIPGTRPSGILTAGAAQKLINIDGCHVGERIVILGSGDVGLIMARRLTLEGKQVLAVVEQRPYVTGLLRNKLQCVDDFGIPLLLAHTVTRIMGEKRLEGILVSQVDEHSAIIPGTERELSCDTLITSVGLIPEAELCRDAGLEMDQTASAPRVDAWGQTSAPGVFVCGNVLFVHDLVDDVTMEAQRVGRSAARFAQGLSLDDANIIAVKPPAKDIERVGEDYESIVCTVCPTGCEIHVEKNEQGIHLVGNNCEQGVDYALQELSHPKRNYTSTISLAGNPANRLPVRTSKPIPKGSWEKAMKEIKALQVEKPVVHGHVLLRSVAGSDANLIAVPILEVQ